MTWLRRLLRRLAFRLALRAPLLHRVAVEADQLQERNADLRAQLAERERRAQIQGLISDYREAIALAGGGWIERPAERVDAGQRAIAIHEAYRRVQESDSTAVVQCKEYLIELELALEDRGWKRQLAMADTEFSRYGIQQLILICRLYGIKHPLIRRGIQVCGYYVFGTGFEISTTNKAAQKILDDFLERNKGEIGQSALVGKDEALQTDGNIFWTFFSDVSTGDLSVRTIDPTEIDEIITDPDDYSQPWFYKRRWIQHDITATGALTQRARVEWYVDMNAVDLPRAQRYLATGIGGYGFAKDAAGNYITIYHRKRGGQSRWRFGVPEVYGAIDWARALREYLEDWCTVHRQLARISQIIETQGGAPAIAALKNAFATTLANNLTSIETNPAPVTGSVFITDPGNKLQNLKAAGMTDSPEQARRLVLMIAAHFGVPETFLGDASVGSLATAQSLDRPTELRFLERQEMWREDLLVLCGEALRRSGRAPSGKLREALGDASKVFRVVEMTRRYLPSGQWVYEASRTIDPSKIELRVDFPAIREGDIPALIDAAVKAATLGNRGGEYVGIDEKAFVRLMYQYLAIPDGDRLAEEQYPDGKYDPDRTEQIAPPPIGKLKPAGGIQMTPEQVGSLTATKDTGIEPATEAALDALFAALRAREAARGASEVDAGGTWVTINGQHVLIKDGQVVGGPKDLIGMTLTKSTAVTEPSERTKRALENQVRANAEEQRMADYSERRLSQAIGVPQTPDNAAFDLRNEKIGIEVKTLIHTKNDKITMSKTALARKKEEIEQSKIKAYTVVVDRRGDGGAKYYYREGVGSFRLAKMNPVSLPELKSIVRGGK